MTVEAVHQMITIQVAVQKVQEIPIKIHLTKNLQITVHQIKIPIATKVIATVQLPTDSMYHLAPTDK